MIAANGARVMNWRRRYALAPSWDGLGDLRHLRRALVEREHLASEHCGHDEREERNHADDGDDAEVLVREPGTIGNGLGVQGCLRGKGVRRHQTSFKSTTLA